MINMTEFKGATKYRHLTTHKISYELYDAKTTLMRDYHVAKKKKEGYLEIKDVACFGNLPGKTRSLGATKVRYVVEEDPAVEKEHAHFPKLTLTEVRDWLRINRKFGLLPKSVRWVPGNGYKQQIILDMTRYPLNLVYFYLALFRYLREDTGVVKTFLQLVKGYNINPYVALVAANVMSCDFKGHSVLPGVRSYLIPDNIQSITFPVTDARKLRLFVTNATRYTKHKAKDPNAFFYLHSTINSINIDLPSASIPIRHADNYLVSKFVMSYDKDEVTKCYNSMTKLLV